MNKNLNIILLTLFLLAVLVQAEDARRKRKNNAEAGPIEQGRIDSPIKHIDQNKITLEDKPIQCSEFSFLPMPKIIKCDPKGEEKYFKDICSILFVINHDEKHNAKDHKHIIELIQDQQHKTFQCHISFVVIGKQGKQNEYTSKGFQYFVDVSIEDHRLQSPIDVKEEAYHIEIGVKQTKIAAHYYTGFVRGLQTFYQAIQCDKSLHCSISQLPLTIDDEPAFSWRSLMVDTSRHYQPIHLLYETVDALMYNKMSVMHWHIVDEDSFPLKLEKHPELSQYAAFSPEEVYTTDQVRDLVRYAMVRGVRIVPELDTPGHAASWGRAPQHQQNACRFKGKGYMGPLDVTLDSTYTLVKQVFAEIFELFPDPVVHLGGDQVVLECLKNVTQFLKRQKIKYNEIELHYRKKQRKILKSLNPNKTLMYWINKFDVKVEESDIIHWWGRQKLPSVPNKLVVSEFGPFYIDMGVGNYYGLKYGTFSTWLDIFNKNLGTIASKSQAKENVLGGELTLWSELSNRYTHHVKIWMRACSLAERAWATSDYSNNNGFFRRLVRHEKVMNRRGIPTSAVTSQQCELNPMLCHA